VAGGMNDHSLPEQPLQFDSGGSLNEASLPSVVSSLTDSEFPNSKLIIQVFANILRNLLATAKGLFGKEVHAMQVHADNAWTL
jgi:hypothetical protein